MCEGSVDGATVYTGGGADTETIARAEFDSAVTNTGSVELASLDELDPGVQYSLYAWLMSNESSARGPVFTADDLAQLELGTVLAIDLEGSGYRVRDFIRSEFEAMVLDHCDELRYSGRGSGASALMS